jgi:hypothetical protein
MLKYNILNKNIQLDTTNLTDVSTKIDELEIKISNLYLDITNAQEYLN